MVLSHSLSRSKLTGEKNIQLQVRDRATGQVYLLPIFTWNTIEEIKQNLEAQHHVKSENIRLYLQQQALTDRHPLNHYLSQPLTTPLLLSFESSLSPITPLFSMPSLNPLLTQISQGLTQKILPKLAEDGTSGSYFLSNAHHQVKAIFKPYDEEPYCPNNPRGFVGKNGSAGFRQGILSGESAIREFLASFIDNEQFFDVPLTSFVEINDPVFKQRKVGSLQAFVEHEDVVANFGTRAFSVKEAHKVAILDLRIINCDRNEQNILVKKYPYKHRIYHNQQQDNIEYNNQIYKQNSLNYSLKFFPIDHGLSFPDVFDTFQYDIIWMRWPQSKQPFSEEELLYIDKIDPIKDAEDIQGKVQIRKHCLFNFIIANILLKKGAAAGLNLYEIGTLMYKKYNEDITQLQQIINRIHSIIPVIAQFDLENLTSIQSDYRSQDQFVRPRKMTQDVTGGLEIIGQSQIQRVMMEDELGKKRRKRSISDPFLRENNVQTVELSDEKKYRKLFFYYLHHFLDIIIKKTKVAQNARQRKTSLNF